MSTIAQLESWLKAKPGDRFALYTLALQLKKAGRTREALERFRELLAAHPQSGAGHYQHGLLHHEQGDDGAARAAWEAGLAALVGATGAEGRQSRAEIQAALDAIDD